MVSIGLARPVVNVEWVEGKHEFTVVGGRVCCQFLLAGIAGTVSTIINPGIVSFTQITGVVSRRVAGRAGDTWPRLGW